MSNAPPPQGSQDPTPDGQLGKFLDALHREPSNRQTESGDEKNPVSDSTIRFHGAALIAISDITVRGNTQDNGHSLEGDDTSWRLSHEQLVARGIEPSEEELVGEGYYDDEGGKDEDSNEWLFLDAGDDSDFIRFEDGDDDSDSGIIELDDGGFGRVLQRIKAKLQAGGPAVDPSIVLAYVNDELQVDADHRTLTQDERADVLKNIANYTDWFNVYWEMRTSTPASEDAEAFSLLEPDDLLFADLLVIAGYVTHSTSADAADSASVLNLPPADSNPQAIAAAELDYDPDDEGERLI